MIGRRSFLAGILGAAAAPAIVKAESLMKIIVPRKRLYTGEIGVIDSGLTILLDADARLRREMFLRHSEFVLKLEHFAAARPMPAQTGKTIRFRRWDGTILHSSPLHDIISTRKTS